MATQKWLRGRESDCQMEEARLRKGTCLWDVYLYRTNGERTIVVLSKMHTDERDKLQRNLHLSGTTSAAERGSNYRMCELWMSWLFFC